MRLERARFLVPAELYRPAALTAIVRTYGAEFPVVILAREARHPDGHDVPVAVRTRAPVQVPVLLHAPMIAPLARYITLAEGSLRLVATAAYNWISG